MEEPICGSRHRREEQIGGAARARRIRFAMTPLDELSSSPPSVCHRKSRRRARCPPPASSWERKRAPPLGGAPRSDQASRFGRFQIRAYSPSFSLGQSAAVIGALKLGSSSLTEMYSSPSLETAFQPAPTSTPLPAVMRKSGASRETRSIGFRRAFMLTVRVRTLPMMELLPLVVNSPMTAIVVTFPVCSGRAHRVLDDGVKTDGDRRRTPTGPERSGGRQGAAFLAREECEPVRRGRKLRMAVAAKAVETKASFGHTRSIEVCVGVASPNRIAHDMPRDHSGNSNQGAVGTIVIGTTFTPRHGCGPAGLFDAFADGWVRATDRSTTEPSPIGWCLPQPGESLGYAAPLHPTPTPHRLTGTEETPRFRELAVLALSPAEFRSMAGHLPLQMARSAIAAARERCPRPRTFLRIRWARDRVGRDLRRSTGRLRQEGRMPAGVFHSAQFRLSIVRRDHAAALRVRESWKACFCARVRSVFIGGLHLGAGRSRSMAPVGVRNRSRSPRRQSRVAARLRSGPRSGLIDGDPGWTRKPSIKSRNGTPPGSQPRVSKILLIQNTSSHTKLWWSVHTGLGVARCDCRPTVEKELHAVSNRKFEGVSQGRRILHRCVAQFLFAHRTISRQYAYS